MTTPDSANYTTAEQRATIYKLLSDCYQTPDDGTSLTFRQAVELAQELYPDTGFSITGGGESEGIRELKVDHARLFVGPFSLLAPPYGSVYLDHAEHLMTDSTVEVQKWYSREGMDVAIREVPDHIRIELEFMYYLTYREAQVLTPDFDAVKAVEPDLTGDTYQKKQLDFLDGHPAKWISEFSHKVGEHARTTFYKDLAEVTRIFLHRELKFLRKEAIVM